MESQDQKYDVVCEYPKAQVYHVDGSTKKPIDEGVLQLVEIESGKVYLLSVGNFKYSLSHEIPVLAKRLAKTETIYILPDVEGHVGIHLPDDTLNLDLLEGVLNSVCQLAFEDQEVHHVDEEPHDAVKLVKKNSTPDVEKEIPKADDKDVNIVSHYITLAGDFLKDGITTIAVYAATGVNSAATYVSEKFIQQGSEYKMWNITSNSIEGAKTLTDKAVSFKSNHVGNAMSHTAKIAMKLHGMFENSAVGKKIVDIEAYKAAKDVGSAALFATAGIYDSMSDAMDVVAGSFNKATTDVVTKRYGEKAGKATANIMGTWANIGKFFKSVKQGTAQSLAKGIKEGREKAEREAKKSNDTPKP